jgi:hypothetical protein
MITTGPRSLGYRFIAGSAVVPAINDVAIKAKQPVPFTRRQPGGQSTLLQASSSLVQRLTLFAL